MGKLKNDTPLKAIRLYCLGCVCSTDEHKFYKEVRDCHVENCPLHPYRMGHNPKRKGITGKKVVYNFNSENT